MVSRTTSPAGAGAQGAKQAGVHGALRRHTARLVRRALRHARCDPAREGAEALAATVEDRADREDEPRVERVACGDRVVSMGGATFSSAPKRNRSGMDRRVKPDDDDGREAADNRQQPPSRNHSTPQRTHRMPPSSRGMTRWKVWGALLPLAADFSSQLTPPCRHPEALAVARTHLSSSCHGLTVASRPERFRSTRAIPPCAWSLPPSRGRATAEVEGGGS